jgi:quercetin dioxygenase-like cupin family protein
MIVSWSIGAGVHVEPHSHPNEQIVWIAKGEICGRGDVVVIAGGVEHEAWFHEDTEVIDFFAPPRDDVLDQRFQNSNHIGLSEFRSSSPRQTLLH